MTSIVRPSPADMMRRMIVLAAVIFAVVVAYGQMAVGWGQTPQEFSADDDSTLRVASYAFSIWGLIYLGLFAYAIRQALPRTGESVLLRRLGWPSVAALLGIGWWIVASAMDWETMTIVLIFGSMLVLLVPLLVNASEIRRLPRTDRERWLVVWPLAMLAGWLTVASPVNLLTVLTGNGALPPMLSPTLWAGTAVTAVMVIGLAVTWVLRTPAYALPIVWGLIGAFVAEQERNMPLAISALFAAGVLLVGTVVLALRLAPAGRVER